MNILKRFLCHKLEDDMKQYRWEHEEYIGEVYCGYFRGKAISCFCPINTSFGPRQNVTIDFYKFKMASIYGIKRDALKIWGDWHPLENIIFNGEEDNKEIIIEKYKEARERNKEETHWAKKAMREIEKAHPIRTIFG